MGLYQCPGDSQPRIDAVSFGGVFLVEGIKGDDGFRR
jgi:hypothetical protein